MSTECIVDISKLEACFSQENIARAAATFIEAAASDSNRYVPYDTGSLHDSMVLTPETFEWRQPYAQAVYYKDDATTNWTRRGYTDPHSHWFERAKSEHMDDWVKATTKTLLKPLGRPL